MARIYLALMTTSTFLSQVVSQSSNTSLDVSIADGMKENGSRVIEDSQRDCKNVNAVVNAGIRMNSDNITHLNIYEALNSQLVDLECSVTLLIVMDHRFKWFKSCPRDKTPQRWNDRYFVLNDAVLVSSVRVADRICWTYRHNSRVIQVLNKSFHNCHLTCKIDLDDSITGGEKRQLNFTITIKIVENQNQPENNFFLKLGCANYFEYTEIFASLGAVLVLLPYIVWYRMYLRRLNESLKSQPSLVTQPSNTQARGSILSKDQSEL